MDKVAVDGLTLEYEIRGAGEPVVFIHGALIADTFRPLLTEPSLAKGYQLVLYHRRGYERSSPVPSAIGVAEQAADCRALLRRLGITHAHIVGHSYGGCIALQFALDYPAVVHSLTLIEPALAVGTTGEAYRNALAQGQQRFREQSPADVVEAFLKARWGAGYRRAVVDGIVPGAFAQAVRDAATWFESEVSGWLDWHFGEPEARRISQPTLAVLGGDSNALWSRFGEVQNLLLRWMPRAEGAAIPATTHFLQMQEPGATAEALARFFMRHATKSSISRSATD